MATPPIALPQGNPTLDAINALPDSSKQALATAHQHLLGQAQAQTQAQAAPPQQITPPAQVPTLGPSPVDVSGSQKEFSRLTAPAAPGVHDHTQTGLSGIEQIHNPWARVPLQILDAVGETFAPRLAAALPGTQSHHNMLVGQQENAINEGETEASDQQKRGLEAAQTGLANTENSELPGKTISTENLQSAQTDEANAKTYLMQHPEAKSAFELWQKQNPNGTAADWMKVENSGKTPTNALQLWAQQNPNGKVEDFLKLQSQNKTQNPEETFVAEYQKTHPGSTFAQADRAYALNRHVGSENEGTWMMAEDENGKPVLFNSKTAQTREAPTGLSKAGTHAKQDAAVAPIRQAQTYAQDYLKNGVFTGPGDEALQEKFFELAKPSTGFRMSQPQMDMLQSSRSWMQSAEGKAMHAKTGVWFSPEQRKQIVDTMNQLAQAKGLGANAPSGQGGTQSFKVNGRTYNIPADQVEEFKKDMGLK